jgi:MFS family permease
MVFNGVGAGINELTALAATSEIAPTRKRGIYVSALIFTIIPFVPSVLYAQLIAYYSSWRYIGVICCVWSALGVALTAIFYFPPPRVNTKGYSRAQILQEIDWIGGVLSITGVCLLITGLQYGGYMHPWKSAYVLAPLIIGIFLIGAFLWWQSSAMNAHPMFPRRLRQG